MGVQVNKKAQTIKIETDFLVEDTNKERKSYGLVSLAQKFAMASVFDETK